MRFGGRAGDPGFPRRDGGAGTLDDYRFDLTPISTRVVIRLAGSDPHQDALASVTGVDGAEAVIPRRSDEEERTDAPMPVRLFVARRLVGPVGRVPRGLEAAVSQTLARLEAAGRRPRIPAEVRRTRHGLRVDLQLGRTL